VLAKQLLGTDDVVGRAIVVSINGWLGSVRTTHTTTAAIIGVVAGTHVVGQGSAAELYLPFTQQYAPLVAIAARAVDGAAPVEALRAAIHATDPELAVSFVAPIAVLANGPLAFVGNLATVLLALASLALALSMTGLYGVLSHVMTRRTREMGIRMAVGATKRHIVTLVLKDGFRPIVEGLFIGLATATVIRVFLKTALLAETVAPIDLMACVASTGLLVVAGALACYLPARRAASVDPNVALRDL
jgi:FtsX-like permease family